MPAGQPGHRDSEMGGRERQAAEAKFFAALAEAPGCCKSGELRVIWRETQPKTSVADLWQTKT